MRAVSPKSKDAQLWVPDQVSTWYIQNVPKEISITVRKSEREMSYSEVMFENLGAKVSAADSVEMIVHDKKFISLRKHWSSIGLKHKGTPKSRKP